MPEGEKSFIPLTYEDIFSLIEKHINIENTKEWVEYLKRRYLF